MNTKLLLASLIGVGSIGGAIAGGYYLSQEEKTQETVSNKQSNTAKGEQTTNEVSRPNTKATPTPLTTVQPAPTSPDVPKEHAPTTPKEPGTSGNEVTANGVEGGGAARSDSVSTGLGV